MRVFVTGSSSHLAAALLPLLCASPKVERVTGIDLRPARYAHPKFHAAHLDVRSPQLETLLAGHQALVHLAFVVLRGKMNEKEMHAINVGGGRAVFRAARRAGIGRLVHLSSAAVYGSGSGLDENATLDPLPHFLYAEHKAELEAWLASEFPECVRLRPHIVLGPHAQPLLSELLDQRFYLSLPEPQPLLQCVHEADVAQAVLLAIERAVRGAFNLAAEGLFSFRDVVRARHRVSIPVPLTVARAAVGCAWRLRGWGGEAAWVEGLARSLVLDCRRAHAVLGWRPTYDAASTLTATRAADRREATCGRSDKTARSTR